MYIISVVDSFRPLTLRNNKTQVTEHQWYQFDSMTLVYDLS